MDFCYWDWPLVELEGRNLGIVGFGRIGRETAKLGRAFGMGVLAHDANRIDPSPGVRAVDDVLPGPEPVHAVGHAALQNLVDDIQKDVTGTVRVKLYKGNCYVVGRKAPRSLYNAELATFEAEDVYNQRDADGFIKLNALRLRLQKLKEGK